MRDIIRYPVSSYFLIKYPEVLKRINVLGLQGIKSDIVKVCAYFTTISLLIKYHEKSTMTLRDTRREMTPNIPIFSYSYEINVSIS